MGTDQPTIQGQVDRLGDARWQSVQRQALAVQVGRIQGNRHLQQVMAALKQPEQIAPYQSNTDNHHSSNEALFHLEPRTSLQRRAGPTETTAEAEAGPSEEEKATALAAAEAAEQVAAQAAAAGKEEVAKSKAEQAAETQAGQVAQQQVVEAKAVGPAKKGSAQAETSEIGQAGPNGTEQTAAKDVTEAVGPGEAQISANGAGPKGGGKGATKGKAPASPEEDPAFQAVVGDVKDVAAQQQTHSPAKDKADEAQAAAESPASEIESKAQANQVGEMEQAETPAFDAAAFKAQLMERIAALAPKTAAEADNFKKDNKLGGLKGEMQSKVQEEQAASQAPLEEKAAAAPDTGSVVPKPVTPLAPTDPGPAPSDVGAVKAAPKTKGQAEVEAPRQESSQSLDQQMAEAEITEEQLANSNEPEFQGALEAKKEAQTHAQEAPQAYRQAEQAQLSQAEAEAIAAAQEKTQAMHGDRTQLLSQVEGQQGQAKSEDEQARAKVAADIQKIYDETKSNVETILSELDGKVESVFDEGAAAAKQAFEDYVDAKMEAYKEKRYGGWLGWAKDKLLGMPSEVNAFYQQGRQLYLDKMDAVLDNVVAIIGAGLTEAKAEIARGKQEIQDYVNKLPENLREVGQQAVQDIQSKFDQLEQRVNDKQNQLIDSLAQKYQENLQAIDARIEEMKAANRGLVDKALDAVGGVIKTILELKNMLLSVLSRVAGAVTKIIKDPIGFLGNLISGIKQGLQNFVANIGTHLKKGLLSWLFGAMTEAGIQMPESFDLKGILSLVMQVLGLTWQNIRARAVKLFGEGLVSRLETVFEIFKIIKEQGLGGLWNYIKDMLSGLKEMVIDAIKDMVITQVIQAGIQWLLGILGGPAGAFIKAAKAIYDIVMWFINNGSQLMALVNAIINSVAAIASGAVGQAVKFIEDSLAKAIPVVISFLASLLGLGNISSKIKNIIKKVQKPINKAIGWVLKQAKKVAKKIGKALGIGKEEKGKKGKVKAGLRALEIEEQKLAKNGTVGRVEAQKVAARVQSRYSVFQSIRIVDGGDSWDYDYVVQRAKLKTKIKKKAEAKLEHTPTTHPNEFEGVRQRKGKRNKKTGEIWELDKLHKDHYEVYKNMKNYDKGVRDRSVWTDGRPKQKF